QQNIVEEVLVHLRCNGRTFICCSCCRRGRCCWCSCTPLFGCCSTFFGSSFLRSYRFFPFYSSLNGIRSYLILLKRIRRTRKQQTDNQQTSKNGLKLFIYL